MLCASDPNWPHTLLQHHYSRCNRPHTVALLVNPLTNVKAAMDDPLPLPTMRVTPCNEGQWRPQPFFQQHGSSLVWYSCCPTCSSHRCVLPEVSAVLEDPIGREEDQQTIWHHAGKVDNSIPQVLLVLAIVPVVVAAVQSCALRTHRDYAYPHLQDLGYLTCLLIRIRPWTGIMLGTCSIAAHKLDSTQQEFCMCLP